MIKEQICNICLENKSIDKFEWQKNRPNPRKTCKKCRDKNRCSIKRREWRRKWLNKKKSIDPRYSSKSIEKSLYGVCKEDFSYNQCWICGSENKICIDHCHKTNTVRGLLCINCNLALGNFKDNTKILERAIVYLKTKPHFELSNYFING